MRTRLAFGLFGAALAGMTATGVAGPAGTTPASPLAVRTTVGQGTPVMETIGIVRPWTLNRFALGVRGRGSVQWVNPVTEGFGVECGLRGEYALPGAVFRLDVAMERVANLAYTPESPVFESGVEIRRGAITWDAAFGYRDVALPTPPNLVTSWTAPPGFHSPPDKIPTIPYWEERAPHRLSLTSLQLGAEWARARWSVGARSGIAWGDGTSPLFLGSVRTVRSLRPGLGATLEATAATPTWVSGDFQQRPGVRVGLVLEPGRRIEPDPAPAHPRDVRWQTLAVAPAVYVLRVRTHDATRAEMRGDFTSWEPVTLTQDGSGWWTVTVTLSPGVHQVEISLAGAYGDVGVLVVN